jgi:hypothetical protein
MLGRVAQVDSHEDGQGNNGCQQQEASSRL